MDIVRKIYSRSEYPDGFRFGDFMKTLEEMADEYLATAKEIKKKTKELKQRDPGPNPAAIHSKIAMYEDMHSEIMQTYKTLKGYYKR